MYDNRVGRLHKSAKTSHCPGAILASLKDQFTVWGSRVYRAFGFRVLGFLGVSGFGFGVLGILGSMGAFGFWGLGFRVYLYNPKP